MISFTLSLAVILFLLFKVIIELSMFLIITLMSEVIALNLLFSSVLILLSSADLSSFSCFELFTGGGVITAFGVLDFS